MPNTRELWELAECKKFTRCSQATAKTLFIFTSLKSVRFPCVHTIFSFFSLTNCRIRCIKRKSVVRICLLYSTRTYTWNERMKIYANVWANVCANAALCEHIAMFSLRTAERGWVLTLVTQLPKGTTKNVATVSRVSQFNRVFAQC